MGCATIDFTDLGDLAATSFPKVSGLGDQRFISNRKSALSTASKALSARAQLCRKSWNKSRSWRRRIPPSYSTGRLEPARS